MVSHFPLGCMYVFIIKYVSVVILVNTYQFLLLSLSKPADKTFPNSEKVVVARSPPVLQYNICCDII